MCQAQEFRLSSYGMSDYGNTKGTWLAPLFAGLAWSLCATGFTFATDTFFGIGCAAVGALTASLLAQLFRYDVGICGAFAERASWVWTVVVFVIALLLSWVVPHLLTIEAFGLSLTHMLVISDGVEIGFLSLAFVYLVRRVCVRWKLAFLEASIVVLAFSRIASPHRMSLYRPYWLADWLLTNGRDPAYGVWCLGLLATVAFALVMFSHASDARSSGVTWKRNLVQFVLLGFLLSFAIMLSSTMFPSLKRSTLPPPPPPQHESSQSMPPPPPPPEPVARIDFERYCRPSQRLGAYYFRTKTFSKITNYQFEENETTDFSWNTLDTFGREGASVLLDEGADTNRCMTVVSHLDRPDRPLGLLLPDSYEPVAARYQNVSKTYRVRSAGLGAGAIDLEPLENYTFLGLSKVSLMCRQWSEAETNLYSEVPRDEKLQRLTRAILDNAGYEGRYPLGRVRAITRWIGNNRAYSERTGSTNAVEAFLFENQAGASLQFATSAALLFRTAGVPTRLSAGYRHAVAAGDATASFVIYNKDATYWPEIFVDGSGWLPVPSTPTNILDRAESKNANDVDREKELFAPLAGSKKTNLKAVTDKAARPPLARFVLFSCGALLLLIFPAVWRRLLSPCFCPAAKVPSRTFRAALDLAAIGGYKRDFGETREEFAERVSLSERWGVLFNELTLAHLEHFKPKASKPVISRAVLVSKLIRLERSVTLECARMCVRSPTWNTRYHRLLMQFDLFSWWSADKPHPKIHE